MHLAMFEITDLQSKTPPPTTCEPLSCIPRTHQAPAHLFSWRVPALWVIGIRDGWAQKPPWCLSLLRLLNLVSNFEQLRSQT